MIRRRAFNVFIRNLFNKIRNDGKVDRLWQFVESNDPVGMGEWIFATYNHYLEGEELEQLYVLTYQNLYTRGGSSKRTVASRVRRTWQRRAMSGDANHVYELVLGDETAYTYLIDSIGRVLEGGSLLPFSSALQKIASRYDLSREDIVDLKSMLIDHFVTRLKN